MTRDLYTSGEYLQKNPLWHADESPWKAKYVLQMIARNKIAPKTVCDVGCGAGEVLHVASELSPIRVEREQEEPLETRAEACRLRSENDPGIAESGSLRDSPRLGCSCHGAVETARPGKMTPL